MRISDWSSDVCSSDLGGEGTEDDAVHVDRPQPPEGELQGSTQVVGKIEQGRDGDAHRRGQHQPEHAPVEPQPDEPAVNQLVQVLRPQLSRTLYHRPPPAPPVRSRSEEHTSELQSII